MTRDRVPALIITICFTGLVTGYIVPIVSLWQTPDYIAWNGKDENITCHIEVALNVKRIMVKWMQRNQTEVKNETIDNLNYRGNVSGSVWFNATLNLLSSVRHSGSYYCEARIDVPVLGYKVSENGTYVYVVPNITTVPTPTTNPGPPNHDNKDKLRWFLLSGLGFILLIIWIYCVIHCKGCCRIEPRTKQTLVDAIDSPSHEAQESVVYSAIKIPRDSVKSRNEILAPLALTSETCTQDSVTYSEVHLKKRPKDEGEG